MDDLTQSGAPETVVEPVETDDLSDLENLNLEGLTQVEPAEKPKDDAPPTTDKPTDEILYDTRHTDPVTGKTTGSVYKSVEEMRKGTMEKDRLNERTLQYANRIADEKTRLAEENKQLHERLRAAGHSSAQASHIADKETARRVADERAQEISLPQEVIDAFGGDTDVAKAFVKAVVEPFRNEISQLRSQVEETKKAAPSSVQAYIEKMDRRREINTLAQAHPDLYTDIDTAIIAAQDPQHPQHEQGTRLAKVYDLADRMECPIEEAHQILLYQTQQKDFQKEIDKARDEGKKAGVAETMKRLKDGGARAVQRRTPGDGSMPTPEEVANYDPVQREQFKLQQASRLDLEGIDKL